MMKMFKFKSKLEFLDLPTSKRCYYLARLYIHRDKSVNKLPYQQRLFSCVGYLKKQPVPILSVLYNYLTDNEEGHQGLRIWDVLPKAILYDQEQRRKLNDLKQVYEPYKPEMLDDILAE